MSDRTDGPRQFTEVDWETVAGSSVSRWRPDVPTATTIALLCCLAVALGYDALVVPPGDPTTPFWDVSRVDWLSLFAGCLVVGYGLVPAIRNPGSVLEVARRYPRGVVPLGAAGYVAVLVLLGFVGPIVFPPPELDFDVARQPPAYLLVSTDFVVDCVGPVVEGYCRGTLRTPLGTTRAGESVLVWIAYGARTALQFALVSVAIMLPLAAFSGATAAYYGGWTEAAIMRVVGLQEAVPTFLVYFLMVVFVDPSLFVLIVAYGLFNWGGTAQLVYSAVLSEAEASYVLASEGAGASPQYTIRRHLLPNVSGTVLAEVTLLIPKLILLEALFSFVGLGSEGSFSWGQLVQRGLRFDPAQVEGGFATSLRGTGIGDLGGLWWITLVPMVAIAVTVFAFSVFGDAVGETVDSA